MNTPAHIAASTLVWRHEAGIAPALAVVAGAILPDAPMFGFYAYQRLWVGRSESDIWSHDYFLPGWQLLFDVFNSVPLLLICLLAFHLLRFRVGWLIAASALLHVCCDLPLHHDDAHRHFLPMTNWRFASPISYWDPRHYGFVMIPLELTFALTSCAVVVRSGSAAMRSVAWVTLATYLAGLLFAIVVWGTYLMR